MVLRPYLQVYLEVIPASPDGFISSPAPRVASSVMTIMSTESKTGGPRGMTEPHGRIATATQRNIAYWCMERINKLHP